MADDKKPKKSNLWKYLLGCAGIVVLLGILAIAGFIYYVSQSFTTDPAKAKGIASSFVDFDIPDGYQMESGVNLFGIKAATFQSSKGRGQGIYVMLMRFPKYMAGNRSQMEAKVNEQMQKQGEDKNYTVKDREEEVLTVRGQEVKASRMALVEKGTDADLRQYIFTIDGKGGGVVMVMIQGPEDGFDSSAMDDFISSIK